MTVESASDRASMLADFGQSVTFSPGATFPNRNDETAVITGIFDNGFVEVIGDEANSYATRPTLVCRTADVLNAARNSMVEFSDLVYKVAQVQPDGTGITELILEGPQ